MNVKRFINFIFVICLVAGLVFIPGMTQTHAQEPVQPQQVEAQEIPPEGESGADAWLADFRGQFGKENQSPSTVTGIPVEADFKVEIKDDCGPLPDPYKIQEWKGNIADPQFPLIVLGNWCEATHIAKVKIFSPLYSFVNPNDDLDIPGLVKFHQGNTLLKAFGFELKYKPAQVSVPPFVEVEFQGDLKGRTITASVEASTIQLPCNNGGSSSASDDFKESIGSITFDVNLGCTKCGTIQVFEQDKSGNWVEFANHSFNVSSGINQWKLTDIEAGTYRIKWTLCSGKMYEFDVVVSLSDRNPIVPLPVDYGLCLPLVANMHTLTCEGWSTYIEDQQGVVAKYLGFAIADEWVTNPKQLLLYPGEVGWMTVYFDKKWDGTDLSGGLLQSILVKFIRQDGSEENIISQRFADDLTGKLYASDMNNDIYNWWWFIVKLFIKDSYGNTITCQQRGPGIDPQKGLEMLLITKNPGMPKWLVEQQVQNAWTSARQQHPNDIMAALYDAAKILGVQIPEFPDIVDRESDWQPFIPTFK